MASPLDDKFAQAIASRYRDAYAAFVEGRSGVSPNALLTEMLADHSAGRKMAILRKIVPPEARVSGKNTLAGLLHDANTHYGAEAYRTSNAAAEAVDGGVLSKAVSPTSGSTAAYQAGTPLVGRGKTLLDPQLVEAIGGDDLRTLKKAANKLNADFGLGIRTAGTSRKQLAYDILRGMEEAAGREGATVASAAPSLTGKEIIVRPTPGSLARSGSAIPDAVTETQPWRGNYRIHRIADGAEAGVGGPGVYKGAIPSNRALATVPTVDGGAPAVQQGVSRWGKLAGRGKGLAKWGGRALGALAVVDALMQVADATQGQDDRVRAQRAEGTQADLYRSGQNAMLAEEKTRGRLLDDSLMFNEAADTAGLLNMEGAAAHQVKLELLKERTDLLGIAMRSEPTAIEQVAAMQRFMGAH